MNKADVIARVSEKTGLATSACEKVIDAFEEHAGEALVARLKGDRAKRAEWLAEVAAKSGASAQDCEKILGSLEDVVKSGIYEKLNAFKGLFSRS